MQRSIRASDLSEGAPVMKLKKRINVTTVFAFVVLGVVILMALVPQLFTSYDPLAPDYKSVLQGPSASHWLGTDELGRDIMSRLIYGARNTMMVGLGSSLLAALIGIPLGLIAGYFGGLLDNVIMRILDAFLSFPAMLLAILVITIFGNSVPSLILTIATVNFPRFSRVVRSNVLSLKNREFVEANRAFGAKNSYILFRTLLPNCVSAITVQFSLLTAVAILVEAGLSFIGLGIQPPDPAWGSMLQYSQNYLSQASWYMIAPTVMIFLVVLAVNFFGDFLRDLFDPMKQR